MTKKEIELMLGKPDETIKGNISKTQSRNLVLLQYQS